MKEAIFKNSKRQWMPVDKIVREPQFMGLFPYQPNKVYKIAKNMGQYGYDAAHPIVLWDRTKEGSKKSSLILIDGHMRLEAAKKANLNSGVFVARVKFPDEKTAFEYAVHNQRNRRNIDDAALFKCIAAVDKVKRKGERTDLAQGCAMSGKSAAETAKVVGKSTRQVEKVRYIEKYADDETKAAIESGEKSINKAYQETQAKRKKKTPPTATPGSQKPMNQDSKSSTEYAASDDSISWETLPARLEGINEFLFRNDRVPDSILNQKEIIYQVQEQAKFLLKYANMLMGREQ